MARTTGALCGVESVGEVIDRIVLNVLLGNGDAHSKNWAYVYPDGRTPALSPAYDLVPTALFIPDDDLGLNLAGSKRFEDVRPTSFERLAVKGGWDGTEGRERAIAAVARVVDAWATLAELLPAEQLARLTARRDGLPLMRA